MSRFVCRVAVNIAESDAAENQIGSRRLVLGLTKGNDRVGLGSAQQLTRPAAQPRRGALRSEDAGELTPLRGGT